MDFVTKKLGNKNARKLERLATVLFITLNDEATESKHARSAGLCKLKKIVSLEQANEPVDEVERNQNDWQEGKLA
ncbi:MAG: hypothetical protein OXB95_07475 [Rhodobacteraceae bacterium]|nr:hypothetical protein [Paracoccaceae bacterium]